MTNIQRPRDARAERDRAAAEGRPYAEIIECGLVWDIGAPLPTILQWEHEAHLFFYLRSEEGVGRITFEHCRATSFGPPGEEGHALEGSGWEAYRPMQVVNSRWRARMVGPDSDHVHFVFPFHDTTFECLAVSFRPSRLSGSLVEAVQATIRCRD